MVIQDMIEPGAAYAQTEDGRGGTRYLTAGEAFQFSQAVSLKRIADAVCGTDQTTGIALTLHYIEQRLGPQS